jgi:hypothetical protein
MQKLVLMASFGMTALVMSSSSRGDDPCKVCDCMTVEAWELKSVYYGLRGVNAKNEDSGAITHAFESGAGTVLLSDACGSLPRKDLDTNCNKVKYKNVNWERKCVPPIGKSEGRIYAVKYSATNNWDIDADALKRKECSPNNNPGGGI